MNGSLDRVCNGLLANISEIHKDSEAVGLFLGILIDQIKPYYKKVNFVVPGVIEILMSPVYGELQEWTSKGIMLSIDQKFKKNCEKKTLVKAYFDRKIEICDDNIELKRICREMAEMTDGNFKIYSKGELKYLY